MTDDVDRGRAAVAAVEDAAFGGTSFEDLVTRAVIERSVEAVIAGPWWRVCGPRVAVITPRRSARSSNARNCGDGVEVRLTDEQLTLATVAHELAHALAGIDHGHDAAFRAAHIDITALLAGRPVATVLRDTYTAFQLDVAGRHWPEPYRAVGDGFVVPVS